MHLDFCKIDMRFHINGGDFMDRKIPNFDFDFSPIGQAIKESRTARKLMREQLAEESNYSDQAEAETASAAPFVALKQAAARRSARQWFPPPF